LSPEDPGADAGPGTILVDFDGTVTQVDVGNRLFHRLTGGRARTVVDLWKSGAIGSRECLIRECALARGTRETVLEVARDIALDPGFVSFLEAAGERGWRVRVVSDGLDVYIRAILEREGLGHLPIEANRVRFVNERLLPVFPYTGRGCGRCGNCKGGAVDEAARNGPVVFVGNGLSDRCGALRAPRVFAKGDLARFCRDEGIEFEPFQTFNDVRRGLLDEGA
jgi:2,3-diketo-5-methylthio-1-phosphopentane phosphatase